MAVFVQPGEATISTKFSVSCVSKDVRLVTSAEFARRTLKHFSASRFLAIAVYLYSFSEVLTIRPGVVHSIVCVTCVSNRVIARKLERKQKTKQNKTEQNKKFIPLYYSRQLSRRTRTKTLAMLYLKSQKSI